MAVPLPLAVAMARAMRRCVARSRVQTLRTLAERSSVLVAAAGGPLDHLPPGHIAQPDTVFDPALWESSVRTEVKPVVQAVVTDSANRHAVGYAFDLEDPRMAAAVEGHVQAIESWGQDFKSSVADTLRAGMHEGLSNDNIAAKLQETGPLTDNRAMLISRTETTAAANAGTIEGWRASVDPAGSSVVATKTWLATSDDRTRPDHDEANGQEVPLDEPFDVGGESAMYPGDPDLSPGERCNCRCAMLSGEGSEISAEDAESMDPSEMASLLDSEPGDGLEGDPAVAEDLLAELGDVSGAESTVGQDMAAETNPEGGSIFRPGDDWEASTRQSIADTAADLNSRYDVPLMQVQLDSERLSAGKSNDTIYLPSQWNDPVAMTSRAKEFNGVIIDPTVQGTVRHEYGHILDGALLRLDDKAAYGRLNAFLEEPVPLDLPGGTKWVPRLQSGLEAPSAYGAENRYEFVAEAFSDWTKNGDNAHESSKFIGRLLDEYLAKKPS